MTIEGAIFEESDNPATCVINQNIGSNQTSINSPDDVYVIRSYSDNTYYLYTNGSTLSAKQPADDNELINDKNYQWQFSGTSSGTMKNVRDGPIYYHFRKRTRYRTDRFKLQFWSFYWHLFSIWTLY